MTTTRTDRLSRSTSHAPLARAPREASIVSSLARALSADRWHVTRVQVAGQGTAGVPDLHVSRALQEGFAAPPWEGGIRGWIEVKAGKNALTARQRAWIERAVARGDRAVVVRRETTRSDIIVEGVDGEEVARAESYADLTYILRSLLK